MKIFRLFWPVVLFIIFLPTCSEAQMTDNQIQQKLTNYLAAAERNVDAQGTWKTRPSKIAGLQRALESAEGMLLKLEASTPEVATSFRTQYDALNDQLKAVRAAQTAAKAAQRGNLTGANTSRPSGGKTAAPFQLREKPQQGITSNFHAQNLGEIVFSTNIITKDNPSANLQQSFRATDFIYARIYTANSAQNTVVVYDGTGEQSQFMSGTFYWEVLVDGVKQERIWPNLFLEGDEKTWTTRQHWLHPRAEDEPTAPAWIALINSLPAGIHDISLEYWIEDGKSRPQAPLAVGNFTINKKQGDRIKIGKDWASIRAGMQDRTIEQQVLTLTNNDYSMTEDGSRYTAVKILSTGWRTVHNQISGVPVYRWVEVNIKQLRPDGSCYVQNHAIRQEYSGSGYSPEVRWAGIQEIYGYGGPIDCD